MKGALYLVYTPCENMESARKIEKPLLDSKNAGCCNIIPDVKSLFF